MINNKNINEESIKAMKEFREKQIQSNIKLHILFFILIMLLNLGLFIFILIYKSKISEIKSKTNKNSSSINNDKDSLAQNRNEISHKLINIMANSYSGNYHFSFILETSEQVDKVKNSIVEFYKEKNMNLDKNKFNMNFKYHGIFDGDSFSTLKDLIGFSYHLFFCIEDITHKTFGFYIEDIILFDKKNKYIDKENNCFLMSFQKDGIFKCIGKKNKLELKNNDEGILIIGDGDIIVKNNYLQEKKLGVINYPFKSFDISTINQNIFTEVNGEFQIRGIEIFSFDFN